MISYGDIKSGEATMPAVVTREVGALPALVKAAADKLASATTAAEVLDAKDAASLAYDASKRAARMAKAKKAHDDLIAAAHRAQADALEIEAAAKRRLADEYDGGQERGEIAKGSVRTDIVPQQNDVRPATAAEAGLTRKQVHEARRVRNAESVQPGVVRAALDQAIAEGKEPTRAVVNAAIDDALGKTDPVDTRTEVQRDADTLQSAWDRAGEPGRALFLAANNLRQESNPATGMGGSDVDRSAERASSAVKVGATNSSGESRERQTVGTPPSGANPISKPEAPSMDGARKGPSRTAAEKYQAQVTRQPEGERSTVGEAVASPAPRISQMPANPAASPARQATAAPEVAPPPASGASLSPRINHDCQKAARGEQCPLSHSQASCSKCANDAMKARTQARAA